jgi:thiamine biosynthesis lipoprotein
MARQHRLLLNPTLPYRLNWDICYRIFIVISIAFLIFACDRGKDKVFKETRSAMYTITSITIVSGSQENADKAIKAAYKEIAYLEHLLNFYSEDSEISAINKNAGASPVKVAKETFEIIAKALSVSDNTDGAFDITVGPLVRLWDFKKAGMPQKKQMDSMMKLIGYKNIVLNTERSTVFLVKKGMQIDLGAIIKGYAADKAVETLHKSGIKAGIVTIGGEVKTFGKKPDGTSWNVGITHPRPTQGSYEQIMPPLPPSTFRKEEILAVVRLSDLSISTSGDYEKFFISNGQWYHHIIDPKTGYPAYACQSVSVIASEAALTDAYATGIFVLGPKRGMEILKKLGIDGVIIDNNGKIHVTAGLKDMIEFSDPGLLRSTLYY